MHWKTPIGVLHALQERDIKTRISPAFDTSFNKLLNFDEDFIHKAGIGPFLKMTKIFEAFNDGFNKRKVLQWWQQDWYHFVYGKLCW